MCAPRRRIQACRPSGAGLRHRPRLAFSHRSRGRIRATAGRREKHTLRCRIGHSRGTWATSCAPSCRAGLKIPESKVICVGGLWSRVGTLAAERAVARMLLEMLAQGDSDFDLLFTADGLAPDQLEALQAMRRARVFALIGSPGVGKTSMIRAILNTYSPGLYCVMCTHRKGRQAHRTANWPRGEDYSSAARSRWRALCGLREPALRVQYRVPSFVGITAILWTPGWSWSMKHLCWTSS